MNKELQDAVTVLDKATNSTIVGPTEIYRAFQGMHSYLLNQLILGLLKVCADPHRQGDGRIHLDIQKLAKELW